MIAAIGRGEGAKKREAEQRDAAETGRGGEGVRNAAAGCAAGRKRGMRNAAAPQRCALLAACVERGSLRASSSPRSAAIGTSVDLRPLSPAKRTWTRFTAPGTRPNVCDHTPCAHRLSRNRRASLVAVGDRQVRRDSPAFGSAAPPLSVSLTSLRPWFSSVERARATSLVGSSNISRAPLAEPALDEARDRLRLVAAAQLQREAGQELAASSASLRLSAVSARSEALSASAQSTRLRARARARRRAAGRRTRAACRTGRPSGRCGR
jgi:hypothetical protein